jgi:CRP/FNR family transcriptional regulator, cyclic AMP receptor protein
MARTKDPKLDLIAAVPLFAGFNRREVEALGRLMDEVDVKPGHVLMREGAAGREFFIVVSGSVRVDRKGRKVNELGPGDFLGEIALIDRGPRTATATATEPCRLLVLELGGFRTLLSKYPTVQGKIMRALAERLREAQPRASASLPARPDRSTSGAHSPRS